MAKVTVKIVGKATTDTYPRRLGLVFDGTLGAAGANWWDTHPEYVVKDPTTGADLIIRPPDFTYEGTYELPAGKHTLETAPSSAKGYCWDFEVFINNVSLGLKSGIDNYTRYTASFEVAPSLEETMSAMIGSIVSIMMLVMIISMLTSALKAFKRKE
jgi:hypothetical protein